MQFQPGQSGNPAGRPPGSRNTKTLEVEALLAERAETTAKSILDRAQRGDPAAMRLCMERIAPVGANRPVVIELPPVETPDDVAAAARAVMAALCQGEISAREAINLLTVVERLARLAERVQHMKERHPAWQGGGNARPKPSLEALGEDPPLYSPVNSEPEPAKTEPSGTPAADATAGQGLYSPVNSAMEAAARPQIAPATGSLLEPRRRALTESVSPAALLLGAQPVDPRSYVTEQKWLAELLETGFPGTTKRAAA